ncbi:hypothetical protein ORI20_27945 [Mycobacterium sp. CVI_P3]|uniref:Uncharacterized protein n=1 Tax=Mycobacterium pinniadriaticum TaxID=2994102 RepID=A0ABT3SMF2_9MYCO|nr:hypothetical protein [Mycobacterium pinniadriaticum]MCX2934105.1 hypothetical protein [Mycobacterium pinniadriaticum]MCX2940527.1 hypothetical protein [Mycobacterium pinniadriaticum]
MAERDETPGRERPDEPEDNNPSRRSTEDTVFPESYRKFWRMLLGPWGRR